MAIYGDLEDWVLPDLLTTLANRRKTGTLRLSTATGMVTITYDRGTITSVIPSDSNLSIGRFLVRLGFASEEQIEELLVIQGLGTAARLGELLVDAGYVTQEQVNEAAAAQLTESLLRLLLQSGGTFAFTPEPPPATPPPAAVSPIEAVVLRAIRLADEWLAHHGTNEAVTLHDGATDPATLDALDEPERVLLLGVLNGVSDVRSLALHAQLPIETFDAALERLTERGLLVRHAADTRHEPAG